MHDLEKRVDKRIYSNVTNEVLMGAATGWLPREYAEEISDPRRALVRSKVSVGLEYVAAIGALAVTPVLGVPAAVVGGALALDAIVRSVDIDKNGTASGSIYAKMVEYTGRAIGKIPEVTGGLLRGWLMPAELKRKRIAEGKSTYNEEVKYTLASKAIRGIAVMSMVMGGISLTAMTLGTAYLIPAIMTTGLVSMDALFPGMDEENGELAGSGFGEMAYSAWKFGRDSCKKLYGALKSAPKELESAAEISRLETIEKQKILLPQDDVGSLSLVENGRLSFPEVPNEFDLN
jgi:hypothetical protein